MLQTCPNQLSKSPCELRFSRLLLPESHAQCVFNSYWNSGFTGQVWTEGLHIKNCGGQGCIYTRSDTRSIRGQYEVSLYGLSRSSPWASEARLLHLSWQQQRRRKQQQQEEAAASSSHTQQPACAPLKEWPNISISLKNHGRSGCQDSIYIP